MKITKTALCPYCRRPCKNMISTCKKFIPTATIKPNLRTGTTSKWEKSEAFMHRLVILRQKGKCQVCKMPLKKRKFEYHHICHKAFGGSLHPRNIVALCLDCHKATFSPYTEKQIKKQMTQQKNKSYWKNIGVIE